MVALPMMSTRARKLMKWVAYVLVALLTFVFALQATFPYDRVKEKLIEGLSSKYDVTVGGVDRGIWPGRVTFTAVGLTSRPTKPDEVPTRLLINSLRVDLGVLALIGQTAAVGIDAKIGTGEIEGTVRVSNAFSVPTKYEIDFEGHDLASGSLPLADILPLPLSGKIGLSAALDLPVEKSKEKGAKPAINWQKASGTIGLDCPNNCTVGNGVAKIKPILKNARQQAFAGDGIPFGKLEIQSLSVRVKIDKGKLDITKWDLKSGDVEAHLDFGLDLAPEMNDSQVTGCIRFRATDELRKREPNTASALTTTGAYLVPEDNLFHILLDGKLKDMKRKAQTCGPNGAIAGKEHPGGGSDDSSKHSRPSITFQPPDDTLRTGVAPIDAAAAAPPPTGERDLKGSGAMMTGSATINAPTPAIPSSTAVPPPPPTPVPEGAAPEGTANAGEHPEQHQDQHQDQPPPPAPVVP